MSSIEEDLMEIAQKLKKMAKSVEMKQDDAMELIGALEKIPVDIDSLTVFLRQAFHL
jgi:predicted nucleic acid-binding protein